METAAAIAFVFYCAVIVSGAFMAVFARSMVRALVGLIGTMFGVAGMYLLLASPFIAFMQILVYVGGVCVLIFFAIMLTSASSETPPRPHTLARHVYAILAGVTPAVVFSLVIICAPPDSLLLPKRISVQDLGASLLSHYLLPFELISVILFVAMAGAVFLAWRKWGQK